MLESLRRSLQKVFEKIRSAPYIDEKMLDEILDDLTQSLIEADVNIDLAFQLRDRIKKRVLETKIPEGIPLNNFVMRVVYDELVKLMGERSYPLNIKLGKRNILMFVGLQGSGKTTTVAKVAYYLKKRGYRVAIVCADTYRVGAYEQLKQLAEKINVPFYGDPKEKNPVKIVKKALEMFKRVDVVLVDTAGRHKEEKGLLREMRELAKVLKPDEIILVIDGMIGQRAYEQAKAFAETTPIGSIIVTKLDGSARGGGALTAAATTGAPIKFIGVGEKIEDLEPYVPQRFVARLLGIPDPEFFARLAEEIPISKSVTSGKITLRDLLTYYESIAGKKSIINRFKEMLHLDRFGDKFIEGQIKRQLAILRSMSEEELDNPALLKNPERLERIARGSGTSVIEVRRLIQQFEKMRKLIRALMRSRRISKEVALAKIMQGDFEKSELAELRKYLKGAA
ncbi:MAG: signal recognition particle receptor subunit alpha [Candidatus Njordarchaeales archaeon]